MLVLAAFAGATIRDASAPRPRPPRAAPATTQLGDQRSKEATVKPRQNNILALAAIGTALLALVLSMTGRQRGGAPRALPGREHEAAPLRRAAAEQAQAVPGARDPEGALGPPRRPGRRAAGARALVGRCAPDTVDLGSWCLMNAPYSVDQGRDRQEQLLLRDAEMRGARRIPADGGPARRRCTASQACVDDRRLAADGLDRPRPDQRAQGSARDELDARHDHGRLERGRLDRA